MRRLIAVLLAMVMCFSLFAELAFGEGDTGEIPAEGTAPVNDPTVIIGPEPVPAEPTPAPAEPTTAPTEPTPAPAEPTPAPAEPTPAPAEPTPAPDEPGDEDDPGTEPQGAEGQITITVKCSTPEMLGRYTAGQPETALLTAEVTRPDTETPFPVAISWESSLPSISIEPAQEISETELVKTFSATAKYNGLLNFGAAVITASVPGIAAGEITIKLLPAQYKAVITDGTETGFEFALLDKTDNTYLAGETLTFGFTDSEKNAGKSDYKNFVWEALMRSTDDTGDVPVYVKANDNNSEFTLYADAEYNTVLAATGNVTITLKEKSIRTYTVRVKGDDEGYKTVFVPQDVKKEEDYVFWVAHPEDLDPEDEEFTSEYVYSLPLVTIDEDTYNGYKFERKEESIEFEGKTYARYWEVTIPGFRVTGDIVIDANKCKLKDSKYTVDLSQVGAGLVPFAEDETLKGKTIIDPENEKKQEYYFYYMKNPESGLHPIYSINGVSHALSPMPVSDAFLEEEDSSLYRISNVTGDAAVTLGYNVRKSITDNNENLLIELPAETVKPENDYSFIVRTHDMTELQLTVYISIGTHGIIYPAEGTNVTMIPKTDDLGSYAEFTIPASMIDGDITVEAKSVSKVNCRVKFFDNYNTNTPEKNYTPIQYKSFEFTSPSFVAGTYSTQTHTGEFEAGKAGFCFEILELPLYMVGSKPNVSGTSSDSRLNQYHYDFTGSTMGGKNVTVAIGRSYSDASGFHQLYDVNGGQPLTGDVIVKAKLVPNAYECVMIGADKITSLTNRETYVSNNVTRYTTRRSESPMYRYLFEVNADMAQTRKIYLRVCNAAGSETKTYPYAKENLDKSNGKAQIYGDYITGPVIMKALGKNEFDVYVTGNRASNVIFPYNEKDSQYYNGCVAIGGKDFVFTVSPAAKIKVKVGGTTLVEGRQYAHTVEGNVRKYTIPGMYINGDITISATSVYNITYSGKYEYARPLGKTNPVQYDSVIAGEDYKFILAEGSLSISVGGKASTSGKTSGGKTLAKGRDYKIIGDTVTILADSITDDIVIAIGQVTPNRTSASTAMSTSTKTTETGVELNIETYPYLALDNEKTMYMLVVYGEPNDNEYVCYDSNKMLWVESYDGYVWFEISRERPETFAEHADNYVDTLTDEEIRFNLESEAEDPDAPIEIPEFEEIFNITDEDVISCDVNEDGKVDEEDLRLMRRIFNCDFDGFDDISMRCFVLADADNSGELDMCDAAVIKWNFDWDEEE